MIDSLINAFVVLVIVVDPVGVALLFSTLTQAENEQIRRRTAVRGVAFAATILLVFFVGGDLLLRHLGIGIPAMRIAGGVLLFLLAIEMMFARQSGLRFTTRREQYEAEHKEDISVFPLAFPLIAGPGALTTVLLMASTATDLPVFAGMIGVVVIVLGIALLALLFASRVSGMLGVTGANVLNRLLGLILAALAVQYVIDGIKASFWNA